MPIEANVPEPTRGPKDGPGSYCDRAYGAIARSVMANADNIREQGLAFGSAMQLGFKQASNWIENLGPAGESTAREMRRVAAGADRLAGEWSVSLDRVNRMPKATRVEAGRALRYRTPKETLSPKAQEVYDELAPTFAQSLRMAQQLGGKRMMPDGTMLPIEGSDRPWPTVLTKHGRDIVAAAKRGKREGDVLMAAIRVTMLNHPAIKAGIRDFTPEQQRQVGQVAMGHIDVDTMDDAVIAAGRAVQENVEFGFARMAKVHDNELRGVIDYFERTATELPEEFYDFDPKTALPGHYKKTALMLNATREWGWDMARLDASLGRILQENGPAHAAIVGNYISEGLGRPSEIVLPVLRAASNLMGNYQMMRLFGLTVVGPLRNSGQPFTNALDTPIGAIFKSYKELPPLMHGMIESSREMHEMVLKSGAITLETPATEGMGVYARKAAFIHVGVIEENQYRAAVIGYYGTIENIRRIMDMQGEQGSLARAYSMVRHLSIDPEGAHVRSIERAGIPREKIEEVITRAKDATPEELKELLAKPEEQLTPEDWLTAMRETSKGTQFGYDFANQIIGRRRSIFWRELTRVRGWGFRQGGYIYVSAMKEFVRGNAKPMVKLLATTFVLGEVYNVGRDWLTGQEKSMYRRAQAGTLTNPDGSMDKSAVAWTTLRNIGDGGGLMLLMDVLYGVKSFLGGPVAGSFGNMRRMFQHSVQDPSQTLTAVKDMVDKEFVVTNQAKGAWNRILEQISSDSDRFFQYATWRDRSYKYLAAREDPTIVGDIVEGATKFLRGGPRRDPTERSLTYEQASKAITGKDIDRAASYMARLLRTAEDSKEYSAILTGLKTAKAQRSPLGQVPKAELTRFLKEYPLLERREARALHRDWRTDWEFALRKAKKDARRN